jgi:hypothetical protein
MSQLNEAGRAAQRAASRWDIPPPRASRRFERSHRTGADGTFRCDMQADVSSGPDFERLEFQGARRRLAAMRQPQDGSVLEPAHPEMAGDTPRFLNPMIF